VTTAKSTYPTGLRHPRRSWATALAAVGLLLLATLGAAIVLSREQARSQIRSSFALRGTSSARFAANYLYEQASREERSAGEFLSGARVSPLRFRLVAATLGSSAAVLLDRSGRVLRAYPSDPRVRRQAVAWGRAELMSAERGHAADSSVVSSPATDRAVTAIAVPYASTAGRRILSADYAASGLALDALVEHTISYPEHEVYLVDTSGRLVASSPVTPAVTLAQANPQLARALARASHGAVARSATPTSFTSAHVPGAPWRLVIAVPDARLYASITGWTQIVPWLVLALVSILGTLLVALFARSLADRARLTKLSATMRRNALTDSLTGLYNRRALTEHLTRLSARARRHDEPLSVLMIDLDRFKQTNDTFGHDAGDQVLCTLADCMRDALRVDDIYGRWGGDEFLVALPITDDAGASATATRLREAAAAVDLSSIGLPDGVALSIGVATGTLTSPMELIRQADLSLYRAKGSRRADVLAGR